MDVGKRIAQLREARGWTTNRLANMCGLSQSFLRAVELGEKGISVENLQVKRDLSRVFFTKTFAVIYEFIFFNFLIKDRQTSVNLNFHVIKENLKRSKLKLV